MRGEAKVPERRVLIVLLAALIGLAGLVGCGAPPSEHAAEAARVAEPDHAAEPERATEPPPLGSTRGSTVAVPLEDDRRELVYLTSEASGDALAELRALAPNVYFVPGLDRETALEHAAGAHGADAHLISPEFLAAAPDLRWAQSWSAGVERYLAIEELRGSESIVLTNMRGVHGPAIADHAFAMLLSLTRRMDAFRAAMGEGRWDRGVGEGMTALRDKTMLVVGLGGIGHEIARRADGFGMRVLATARTRKDTPAYVDHLGLADELDGLLPEADVVALAVPLTAETEGLLDRERFALMKPGSYLINIARGKVVDTEALLEALDSGRLAGACLDVTDPEPLPAGHALWSRANVIVTPHVAARAEVTRERREQILRENMRRFAAGEPLLNVVDKEAGY
jgi:phosphoglycerate dehydrogenase-like enzyme